MIHVDEHERDTWPAPEPDESHQPPSEQVALGGLLLIATIGAHVLLVGAGLLTAWLLSGCEFTPVDATPAARQWAAEMGYKVQGISCVDRDSDYDGYVSCAIKPVDLDPISVECNYRIGTGCKIIDTVKVRGSTY